MNRRYLIRFTRILISFVFAFSFHVQAENRQVTSVRDNRHDYPSPQVLRYEKLEISFEVQNFAAQNIYFPYDAESITGLQTRIGVIVDGLFLPRGESDWNKAIMQSASWYQPVPNRSFKIEWWDT